MGSRKPRGRLIALLAIACCCASVLALDARERWPSARHRSIDLDGSSDRNAQGTTASSQRSRARPPRRLSTTGTTIATTTTTPPPTTTTTVGSTSPGDALLLSSAGGGRESGGKKSTAASGSGSSDDDDKKTLSQQVKEGKYGLIQDELFPERSRRPGILSYASNAEVPSDNANNLGGLTEDEIWLAENHVLVLKGGGFSEAEEDPRSGASWPPIDDYQAPRRQVKIPPRPRVPPPFPVQLRDGGPVQLILGNGSAAASSGELLLLPEPRNGSSAIDFEALPGGFRGFLPGEGPYFAPQPEPRLPEQRSNKAELPPFYQSLPPGAVIVPPPSNQTDYDDEDQSMYYPPPYSFVYHGRDNSTAIPPGPLVPGIILPPPPDFFATLDAGPEGRVPPPPPPSKAGSKYSGGKRPRPAATPPRKPSSKPPYKTPPATSPASKEPSYYAPKPFSRPKGYAKPERATPAPPPPPPPPPARPLFVEVTTPAAPGPPSGQATTLESPELEPIIGNQVIADGERVHWGQPQLPLVSFFATTASPTTTTTASTSTSASTTTTTTTTTTAAPPVEQLPSTSTTTASKATERLAPRYPSQASYYFYEEAGAEQPRDQQPPSSSTAEPVIFFGGTAEAPPYRPKLEPLVSPGKSYYDVQQLLDPPRHAPSDFRLKLIDAVVVREPQVYRYVGEPEPPRAQSPRTPPRLSYFATSPPPARPKKTRPETPSSLRHFEDGPNGVAGAHKPKPIYQYSFEATNYPKRGRHIGSPSSLDSLQIQQPRAAVALPDSPLSFLFDELREPRAQQQQLVEPYDYEGSEPVARHHHHHHQQQQQQQQQEVTSTTPATTTRAPPPRDTTLAAHQQYFTKQDEQLLDDVTKEYFSVFGKKLSSTTPVYGKSSAVTERPGGKLALSLGAGYEPNGFGPPNIKVRYGDSTPGPFSPLLRDDVFLDFGRPQGDFVPLVAAAPARPAAPLRSRYPPLPSLHQAGRLRAQEQQVQRPQLPVSLADDVAVNFQQPRPALEPEAEFIGPEPHQQQQQHQLKPNSYFAYKLPGDGGHFYFLTPQAVQARHREQQHLGLYPAASSSSRDPRLLRRRRARDGDP